MESIRTLARRRISCRNFVDRALTREQLTSLINDAVWVPSGSNEQPWRFVVITDRDRLKAYSDTAKKMWLENLDSCPHMRQYESFIRDPDYNIFYNAPALVIVYGNSQSHWYSYDCSMVALNIHLLAEEDGLGCCWIGFAHNVFADPAAKAELGVPADYRLVAPLILGYPAEKRERTENPNKRKLFEICFI